MKARRSLRAVAGAQRPFGLCPVVGFGDRHHLGQVQAGHAGRGLGGGHGFVDMGLRHASPAGRPTMQPFCAPLLRKAGELAGVDVGDGDRVFRTRYWDRVMRRAEVAGQKGQVLDDQACGMDLVGFDVFRVDAVVADVRIRERHDLLAVARVGEDFLVTGDGGVEHDLAGGGAGGSDRIAEKDRAVSKRQDGVRGGSLEGQKHWVLRMVTGTPKRAQKLCSWRPKSLLLIVFTQGKGLNALGVRGFAGKPLIIAACPAGSSCSARMNPALMGH
jgi:hypothetical protein